MSLPRTVDQRGAAHAKNDRQHQLQEAETSPASDFATGEVFESVGVSFLFYFHCAEGGDGFREAQGILGEAVGFPFCAQLSSDDDECVVVHVRRDGVHESKSYECRGASNHPVRLHTYQYDYTDRCLPSMPAVN